MLAIIISTGSVNGVLVETSTDVTVNATLTSAELLDKPTTSSSPQMPCILVALNPFQEEIIHDKADFQHYNLIEYHLVFPNNSVNPLKHNMKHVFKVCCFFAIFDDLCSGYFKLKYGILGLFTLSQVCLSTSFLYQVVTQPH